MAIFREIFGKRITLLTVAAALFFLTFFAVDYYRMSRFLERVEAIDAKLAQAEQSNKQADYYDRQAEQIRAVTLPLIQALADMSRNFKQVADLIAREHEERKPKIAFTKQQQSSLMTCASEKTIWKRYGDYYVIYDNIVPMKNCVRGQ